MKGEKDIINTSKKYDSESSRGEISETNKTYFNSSPLNIGNNIICNKKIYGIRENIYNLISLFIINIIIFLMWLNYIYSYYINNSKFIVKIILLLIPLFFIFSEYYQIKCFITEPGIIPKNSQIYKSNLGDQFIYSKKEHRPIIMVQKHCYICNINRPNKSFHCFLCGNCVEEFENHFIYVSNCIGKRNKKFYLFFLLYHFCFYGLVIFTSFIQLIFSSILFHSFYQIFFNSYSLTLVILSLLILIGIISYFIFHNSTIFILLNLISNIIYFIIFYISKKKYSELSPNYLSPFNIGLISFCIPILFINIIFLSEQIKLICIGLTSLDYKNIINYNKALIESDYDDEKIEKNSRKINKPCIVIKEIPNIKFIPSFNFKNAIINIKEFFQRRIPPSLILQDDF